VVGGDDASARWDRPRRRSNPAFADIDRDGDLDLVVGTKIEPDNPKTGGLYWFENIGSRTAPSFRLRGHLNVLPVFHDAPALGDLDGDGLPDLVVGQFQDAVAWYHNSGKSGADRFVLVDSAVVRLPRGSNGVPELYDIDGDGDLDLFLGDASGRIAFFRNDGSRQAPHFVLVSDDYLGRRVGRRAVPRFLGQALVVGTEQGGSLRVWAFVCRPTQRLSSPIFAGPARRISSWRAGGGISYFIANRPK